MSLNNVRMHSFLNDPVVIYYTSSNVESINTNQIFIDNKTIDIIANYTLNDKYINYIFTCRDKTVPIKQLYNHFKKDMYCNEDKLYLTLPNINYELPFVVEDWGLLDILQKSNIIYFNNFNDTIKKNQCSLICQVVDIKEEWFDKIFECIKKKYNYVNYFIFKKMNNDFNIDYSSGEVQNLFDHIFVYNEYSLLDSMKILEYKNSVDNKLFFIVPGINDITSILHT